MFEIPSALTQLSIKTPKPQGYSASYLQHWWSAFINSWHLTIRYSQPLCLLVYTRKWQILKMD